MTTEGDKTESVPADDASAGVFLRAKSVSTALKLISEAISQDKPVVAVTGPSGAGTSRLLQEWRLEQDDRTEVTLIERPEAEPDDIMAQVVDAYGLDGAGNKRTAMVSEFRKHLLERANAGVSSVLVIDDADAVSVEAIELFKMLASVKHKNHTLLRVVLLGRPSLLEALRVAERPKDADRIAFVSLPPFDAEESLTLFRDVLGTKASVDEDAADVLFGASQGLPGAIVGLARQLSDELGDDLPDVITADHVVGLEGVSADQNASATDINDIQDASKLPRSIRESDDPQALLRFALSNRTKPREPEAGADVARRPEPMPQAKATGAPTPSMPEDMPADLSSALAQLAEAEQATVREGGSVKALPPQRQEGRPPPMKLEGPIGRARRGAGDQTSNETSQNSDQFEFMGSEPEDVAPVEAKTHDALPEPKPRPKVRKMASASARNAIIPPTPKSDPQVYDQSKLREVLRSFDEEPEPEPKKRNYVPIFAGVAGVAALLAAYPFVLGPNGAFPIGGDLLKTAGVTTPSLPKDPDGAAALPEPSVLADWEQKKQLQITREQGPGPAANVAILSQPKSLTAPAQDILAAARPDPVRLSARSAKPDVRPVRVNPLQSGDASSVSSSIALQTTDSELANTLRLKEVAEREIAGLISELSSLRNEVKSLREEKLALSDGMDTAREELAQLEQAVGDKQAALETEQAALDQVVAQNQQVSAELEAQTAELNAQQESLAALREEDNALAATLETARADLDAVQQSLTEQQETVAALNAEVEAGRAEQSELASLLEQGRIELSALDEQSEQRIATLSDLQDTLKLARAERDELATAQADLTAQNASAEDRLGTVTASLLAAETALQKAQDDTSTLVASLDEDTRAATQALANLTEKNQDLGAEIARLESEIEAANAQKEAVLAESNGLKEESQTLAQAVEVARTQAEDFESRHAEAEQQLAGLLPQVEEAQTALAQSQQELQARAETVDRDLAAAMEQLASLSAQKDSYEAEVTALNTEIERSKDTRTALADELELLTQRRDGLADEQFAFEQQLVEVQEELDRSTQALAAAKSDRANALAQLSQDTSAAQTRLEQLQAQNAGLIRQTVDLTKEIETASAQKAQVMQEISSLQDESAEVVAALEQTRADAAELANQRDASALELAEMRDSIVETLAAQKAAEQAANVRLAAIASETQALLKTKDVLSADIAELSDRTKDAAQKELMATAVLGDLNGEIAQTRSDAAEAEQNLERLRDDLRSAQADLDDLRGLAVQVETEIADLRNLQDSETLRLATLQDSVDRARKNAQAAAELTRLAALPTEAGELAPSQSLDEGSVAEVANRFGSEDELARQPAAIAALTASIKRPGVGEDAPQPITALRMREADVVTSALERAPGLAKLSGQEREALRAELINGTCIPDALRKITGTINRPNPARVDPAHGPVHILMKLRLVVNCLASALCLATSAAAQDPYVNVMGGPENSTAMEFASLIAEIGESCGYDTKAHNSFGALENLLGVRERVNTQFGLVQTDVLEYLRAYEGEDPEIAAAISGVRVAFPLYDQEVHILAKKSIAELVDLRGKRVSIGAPDSGDFLTATVMFDLLGYGPSERLTYGPHVALEALRDGRIDAMFLVDGAPSKILAEAEIDPEQFHLLDITDPILEIAYKSDTLKAGVYAFQPEDKQVLTVQAVALTYDYVPLGRNAYNTRNCERVANLTFLTKQWLEENPTLAHPKWSTIELEDEILDWTTSVCAARGLSDTYKPTCR